MLLGTIIISRCVYSSTGGGLSGKTMRVAKLVKICSPRPCVVSRVSLSLSLYQPLRLERGGCRATRQGEGGARVYIRK